ncbi:MAG: hypothetical protein IIB55_05655, partial [Planctomycetes bacterium]|nr:hypothetical protein [Planctomycetota bacterium]
FTGRGPVGTAWFVSRQLAGETNFSFLGQADGKSFVDSTLPAGTVTATYTVHGARGNLTGLPSDPVTFYLGNADAGQIAMAA